jgi:hypothetical protein
VWEERIESKSKVKVKVKVGVEGDTKTPAFAGYMKLVGMV